MPVDLARVLQFRVAMRKYQAAPLGALDDQDNGCFLNFSFFFQRSAESK